MTAAATAPLSWKVYSTTYNLMRAEAPGEKWKIGAKRGSEPVKFAFFLNDGRSLIEIMQDEKAANAEEGSLEYWRHGSLCEFNGDVHGYVDTAEDAIALIEILRTGNPDGGVEALLIEAGFAFQHAFENTSAGGQTRVYHKSVGKAFFSLFVSTDGIHLTFEKNGWGYCNNLVAFWSQAECHDGKPLPVFWPERVEQNFVVLTLKACLAMVERYIADGRHRRRVGAP
jgi:hypothetical protein